MHIHSTWHAWQMTGSAGIRLSLLAQTFDNYIQIKVEMLGHWKKTVNKSLTSWACEHCLQTIGTWLSYELADLCWYGMIYWHHCYISWVPMYWLSSALPAQYSFFKIFNHTNLSTKIVSCGNKSLKGSFLPVIFQS